MTKDEIRAAIFDLSENDRRSLPVEFSVGLSEEKASYSRERMLDNKQGCCPYCTSSNYHKHGIDKGSQRYKCKGCGRTFTEFTGTWMAHLHHCEQQSSNPFNGITESDETFIPYSEKGSRNLKRKPHRRGGISKQKGISDDKVSVIVTADRDNQIDFTVARRRRIRKKLIEQSEH